MTETLNADDPVCVDCEPDRCDELRELIRDILYRDRPAHEGSNNELLGLQHRYGAQLFGQHGPEGIDPNGGGIWESHNQKIAEQQRHLNRTIDEFEENNCRDPPNGTYSFANMALPSPSEWRGPEPGLGSGDAIFLGLIPGVGLARAGAGLLGGIGSWLGGGGAVLAPALP
jgi:hypothetical protein